jgi:hypothetical protein
MMGLRGIDLPMFSARSANGRKSLYRNDRTHAPAGTFRKDGERVLSAQARLGLLVIMLTPLVLP